MSLKAARGTKRVCQNCGSKFYDLNRTPATCPICQTVYQQEQRAKVAPGNAHEDDEEDVIGRPANVELVSLDEVEAAEGELPELEEAELVDLDEEEAADIKDDEAFIEVEDDSGEDVSGLLGGSREDEEEI
jgi:uncharacterized protein (TIGR02300 family)